MSLCDPKRAVLRRAVCESPGHFRRCARLPALDRARYYCAALCVVNFLSWVDLLYLHLSHTKIIVNKMFFKVARSLALGCLIGASAGYGWAQAPAPTTSPSPQPKSDANVHAQKLPVNPSVPDDPSVDQMLVAYSPKVRELDTVIGALKGELRKGGIGAGSLGNFVADGMRWQARVKAGHPIDLALMNGGGIRRNSINEGELRARDIFELLPFENALVTVELTGDQLMRLLRTIVSSREAQSGARIAYFTKADKTSELDTAKLRTPDGERVIDPLATYRVVTIDYLVNVGGDRYAVLREGKNVRPLGITLRDAVIAYVKSEIAAGRIIKPNLDGRFWLDPAKSVVTEETRP